MGIGHLRSLFVMPTDKRMRCNLGLLDRYTGGKGSGMFLFTTRAGLLRHGPLAEVGVGSKGAGVRLL